MIDVLLLLHHSKHYLNSEVEVAVENWSFSERIGPRSLFWFHLGSWQYNCQDAKKDVSCFFVLLGEMKCLPISGPD